MRQRQAQAPSIYPPLLHYGELAKKLKNINNIASTLYYAVHGHLEHLIKTCAQGDSQPTEEGVHKVISSILKLSLMFVEDTEQLATNLATGAGEVKTFMAKHWPKEVPSFNMVEGLHEGKKWENIMSSVDALRASYKMLAHRKKIIFTVKNALFSSRLFQIFEKREKHVVLVL